MIRSTALIAVLLLASQTAVGAPPKAKTPHATPQAEEHSEQAPGPKPPSEVDPLIISIGGDPMNRVGEPIFVSLSVKNNAGKSLRLRNISMQMDRSSGAWVNDEEQCNLQQYGEPVLAQGQTLQQYCRFDVQPSKMSWSIRSWREALMSTDVRLVVDADIDGVGERRYYPTITLKAQEYAIFFGGVVGAFMLAMFIWIERLLSNQRVRQALLKNFLVTLLMGARGGIMAIIALLLGKTTQGTGSPVTLTVTDFSGGVMIGLFSYPLAAWISSALKLDNMLIVSKARPKGRGSEGDGVREGAAEDKKQG